MSETLSKKELNNLTIKAKIYNWSEKQLEEEKTKAIQHKIDFSYSETEKELEERAKELGFENYAQQRLQSFSKKRDEFSLDKVVVPPPFVKKVEALEFTEANIPGEINIDISGKLLKTFFDYEGKIGSLVDQYNNFITYTFPQQVVSKTLEIENGIISFENVIANRPEIKPLVGNMRPLYPQEARNSGYSYTSDIYVDMVLNKGKMGEERIDKVFLGKVPVMLGSNLDWLSSMSEKQRKDKGESLSDPPGYFIIKGAEKVILQQEKLRPNRFMVFSGSSKGDVVCKITNNTLAGSTQISMVKGKKSGALKMHLGFLGRLNCAASNKIGKTISVLQVYRLLGVTEPKTMLNYIFLFTKPEYHKKIYVILQPNIVKLSKIGDDIEYISKKTGTGDLDYNIKKSNIMQELKNQLFPQVEHDNIQGKIYMLSIMIARIAEYLIGVRNLDDRDNWGNKQLATAGKSMELLFSSIWKELINSIQGEIGTKNLNSINSVKAAFPANFITDNFIESFSANKWGVQSKNSYMKKENITDILKRDSILSVYSHLTKVNTPGSDKVKNSKLRMVQMSQLGYIDPGETPEGKQCCRVGTPVLLDDGTWMSIEKIKNDSVVTVNSKTFKQESSKIIEPFLFDTNGTNKKIFRVTTINGRYLEATGDHPFLTQRGWVELKDLNLDNDQLCICPYQNPISNEIKDSVILTEDIFKSLLSKTDIKETIILKHIKELKLKGLLPLKTSHKYLHILARISGFAMADGCLGVYDNKPSIFMVFGQEIDGVDYVNDIVKLGFNKVKISYTENKITDKNTGREAIHKVYRVSKGGSLPSLLIALGLSYGKKTLNSRKPVPNFVMNGSKLIKREYLSGFQGGDGNAIHGSKRKNKVKAHVFGFSEVIQHMCEEYSDSLYSYMTQISKLFEELGVKMGKVKKYKDVKSDNFICSYTISCEENNLIKYMDTIGYRYASTKNMKSIKVVEYLRYKNLLIQERKEIKDKVITFYKNKKTISEISKELNISYRSASSIVEYWKYAGDNTKSLPNPKNLIPYDEFNKVNCIKENKYIFLNIQKIEQIEDAEVADFTTVSDNHSFIANCFVTHNCGLAKNVSMTTYVSLDRPEEIIIETVRNYVSDLRKDDQINPFILNGVFQGWVNGKALKEICVDMKRSLKLPKDTCIVLEKDGFFNIYTDAGRPTRPLMIVDEDGTLVIEKKNLWKSDFETLIREGCIEYIDAWEQENIMLAQKLEDIDYRKRDIEMAERSVKQIQEKITDTKRYFDEEDEQKDKMFLSQAEAALKELLDLPRYTHSEMDPTAILSIAIGIIPLLETNPGPRLTYQAGMGKQSLGIYHSNHSKRFDTSAKVLAYPSRPMFEAQLNDIIGLGELPAGETVIVGITTFTGFSQEDAIVMAQGSVDRGLFRSVVYKTYKSVLKPNEKFTRPSMKKGEEEKYAAIDENGIPILGASVKEGHVIIGKVRFNKRTEKKEDASTRVEVKQAGVIDKVLVTTNADNNRVIKVKIRQVRKPVIGDKFACYTPDHEVMTNNGWKNITELTKEDKVLTLNGFETPTEIQTYNYDGKMYSVQSDNVNLCVTPNHRMYVKLNEKYEIMRADEIYGKKVTYKNLDTEYSEEGNDEWVQYTGKVHCCTVPSGIIYVRRQGKSVWCGNSRYAQKGTIGLIIPDEDMPYTASGMRPDILINPHCFPKDTPVSTHKGYAKRISDFSQEGGEDVWAWDIEEKSFKVSKSMGMESKGIKKLIKVCLEDGREIKCTPDHRFLTVKNDKYEWVEAKDLKSHKVVCGLEMPLDKPENDMGSTWALQSADYNFNMSTPNNREKSLAFARILGYTLTDGCVSNISDSIEDDILLITGKRSLKFPESLVSYIKSLFSSDDFPNFLNFSNCPSSFIREFLAGLFSRKNNFKLNEEKLNSLLIKLNVSFLDINQIKTNSDFIKKIGFRYLEETPSFNLEVIDIFDAGEEEVFDIGVYEQHNFMAHGCVVHNCIPSRMTIGKLIEIVTSKTAAFTGERVNATAFRKFDVKDFMRNLTQYGYASSGKERMFSGYTGEPLEAMIFTGPCYYQALRHQVADKIQMRAKGNVSQLTRQPVEGRKRGGGLRVGEMERDAIISHGASNFLRERLCLVSDAYETVYCSTCGNVAISNVVEEKYICRNCDDKAQFGVCTVPFAFKTLSQLLMGAGFQTKFKMREIPK